MVTTAKASESAAKFIDTQLHTAAGAVERIAGVITAATADSEGRLSRIADPVGNTMKKTADRLRSQDGEEIIDGIKTQMLQHPRKTVGLAAAIGAVAAQMALTLLRSEMKAEAAPRKVKSSPKPIRSKKNRAPDEAITTVHAAV